MDQERKTTWSMEELKGKISDKDWHEYIKLKVDGVLEQYTQNEPNSTAKTETLEIRRAALTLAHTLDGIPTIALEDARDKLIGTSANWIKKHRDDLMSTNTPELIADAIEHHLNRFVSSHAERTTQSGMAMR